MFILFINHVLFSVESCVTAITSRLFIYGTIGIQWSESLYLQAGVRIQEIKSLVIEFRIVRMHVQVGKLIALNVKTIK